MRPDEVTDAQRSPMSCSWLTCRCAARIGCMVVNGYSNNTRLKTHDPNWGVLGYHPRDEAEDYREMLRRKGIDVDGPDRDEWE
jgi:hypothetical protein